MRSLLIIGFAFLAFETCFAQHFTTDENYHDAYALLLDLNFEQAERKIQAMRMADEQNLAAVYLEDLSDFLLIVVAEDERQFKDRKEFKDQRLNLLEKLPNNSAYGLLAQGEVHLHWAILNMRFGQYLNAALGIRKAFILLERNAKNHPDFLPTYKGLGLLHTLVGTVPENYQWATRLVGMEGDLQQGVSEMERILSHTSNDREAKNLKKETLFLLTFIQMSLMNDRESLKHFEELVSQQSGPLMDFTKTKLLMKQGKTDEAISLLQSKPALAEAFPYLKLLLGNMKLSRMDADANVPLQSFISNFEGTSYKKSAQQKLAWHALIVKNDTNSYKALIEGVNDLEGSPLDEDEYAQNEFESGLIPNKTLLKSRLQFDGGYFKDALRTLVSSESSALRTKDEELEFTYRLGRIHHELGNLQDAISYYRMTIEQGAQSKRYFAANASLMLGLIYESQGKTNQAIDAFEACSGFKNSEYRNSINQKARAGILRLED